MKGRDNKKTEEGKQGSIEFWKERREGGMERRTRSDGKVRKNIEMR